MIPLRLALSGISIGAPPTDTDRARVYFHGTPREAAARAILVEGIRPGSVKQGRAQLAPVAEHVYLTASLPYAMIYALGGDVAGHAVREEWFARDGRYGFVFEVSGSELTDIRPDEDVVGEMVHVGGLPLDQQQRFYPDMVGRIPSWLRGEALRVMTSLQRRKMADGEYATFAAVGKKIVRNLTTSQALALIAAGAHVANRGRVRPSRAWRVDKGRSRELARDGSNFFHIATLWWGE